MSDAYRSTDHESASSREAFSPIPLSSDRRGHRFTATHLVHDPGAGKTQELPVMLVDRWGFTEAAWESGDGPIVSSTESGWRAMSGDVIDARPFDSAWSFREVPPTPAWRTPFPHERPEFVPFVETHSLVRGSPNNTEALMVFGGYAYTRDAWSLNHPPSFVIGFDDDGEIEVRELPDGRVLPTSYDVIPVAGIEYDFAGWRDQRGGAHVAMVEVDGLWHLANLEWAGTDAHARASRLQLAVMLLERSSSRMASDFQARSAIAVELAGRLSPIGLWTISAADVRVWAGVDVDARPALDRTSPFIATHRALHAPSGVASWGYRPTEIMVYGTRAYTRDMWSGVGDQPAFRLEEDGTWRAPVSWTEGRALKDVEPLPSRYVGFTGNTDGARHVARIYDGDLQELRVSDHSPADWTTPEGRRTVAVQMAADAVLGRSHVGDGRQEVELFERWLERLATAKEAGWELTHSALHAWAAAPGRFMVAALHEEVPCAPVSLSGGSSSAFPSAPVMPAQEPSMLPPWGR